LQIPAFAEWLIFMQEINSEVRNTFPLPSDKKFFTVANDGIISLHSDDEWIGQNVSSLCSVLTAMLDKDNGDIDFTCEGKKWHALWTTAPETGWKVAIAHLIK